MHERVRVLTQSKRTWRLRSERGSGAASSAPAGVGRRNGGASCTKMGTRTTQQGTSTAAMMLADVEPISMRFMPASPREPTTSRSGRTPRVSTARQSAT